MGKPENPPAFPSGYGDPRNPGWIGGGMSMRDWFAGQALAVMPKLDETDADVHGIAHDAYALADARLAERERKP
jgi:hypothetical protein